MLTNCDKVSRTLFKNMFFRGFPPQLLLNHVKNDTTTSMNIENCYKMVRNGYFSLKTCLRTSKNIFNDFDTLPYYMGVDVRFNGKGVGT